MTDPEGDSRMQQSSSEEDDLDAMFPEPYEPPNTASLTPQNSNLDNLRQFSELSPPNSQDPTDSRSWGNDLMEHAGPHSGLNGGEGSSSNIHDLINSEGSGPPPHRELSVAEREPGASWNNRKTKEEEDRVKELLLDKNFSLREFGDFYNEKDMSDDI
ncbi:MAG: hypothetical protein Q9186_004426 [Xanthomendoza sp. 1 TL-2023]